MSCKNRKINEYEKLERERKPAWLIRHGQYYEISITDPHQTGWPHVAYWSKQGRDCQECYSAG